MADTSKVDVAGLKMNSVLGVVEREQGFKSFGPGKVFEVGRESSELTGIELGSVDEVDAADLAKENKKKIKQNIEDQFNASLEHMLTFSCHYYQGLLLLV